MAKVMISLPDQLLDALDTAAADRSSSRSGLIRDAVRLYLAQAPAADRRKVLKHLQRAFADLREAPEDTIRAERSR